MTEEALLEALRERPKDGIRMLTEAYGGLIYALTWRRLQGRLSKEDIEECVSDIFFELYQCRDRIDLEKGSLKAFLLVIAERRAIKYYDRKAKPYVTVTLDSDEGMEIPAQTDVEREVERNEESRRLMDAIQALGEPGSTIMVQKYYYGMTAKEIGKGLGMSKNAVEKRIKRGLEKLRNILE
ncbi:MAG: sigma-70 family RNA polymerase sigma factor [Eubacteriales bacterium]|nr:sigma-70 family RNA polymerase sigma factor [Eubacteriales bacterium]